MLAPIITCSSWIWLNTRSSESTRWKNCLSYFGLIVQGWSCTQTRNVAGHETETKTEWTGYGRNVFKGIFHIEMFDRMTNATEWAYIGVFWRTKIYAYCWIITSFYYKCTHNYVGCQGAVWRWCVTTWRRRRVDEGGPNSSWRRWQGQVKLRVLVWWRYSSVFRLISSDAHSTEICWLYLRIAAWLTIYGSIVQARNRRHLIGRHICWRRA